MGIGFVSGVCSYRDPSSSSWLGGRSGPSGQMVHPAVQVVSGLLSASYRSIWIPFWLHGNHHGYRASRLDSAQYTALHNQSAAHLMCTLLPDAQFQKAERVALANADASLISVPQACALLGISPNSGASPGTPCSACVSICRHCAARTCGSLASSSKP